MLFSTYSKDSFSLPSYYKNFAYVCTYTALLLSTSIDFKNCFSASSVFYN